MINLLRNFFNRQYTTPQRQPRYAIYLIANVEGRELCGRFQEYYISKQGVDYVVLSDFEYGTNANWKFIEASQVVGTKWVQVN